MNEQECQVMLCKIGLDSNEEIGGKRDMLRLGLLRRIALLDVLCTPSVLHRRFSEAIEPFSAGLSRLHRCRTRRWRCEVVVLELLLLGLEERRRAPCGSLGEEERVDLVNRETFRFGDEEKNDEE